jgi:hypothetical protein
MVSFKLAALLLGKSPPYPFDRTFLSPRAGLGDMEKLKVTETRTPTCRSSSPQIVAAPWALPRLITQAMYETKYLMNLFCRLANSIEMSTTQEATSC